MPDWRPIVKPTFPIGIRHDWSKAHRRLTLLVGEPSELTHIDSIIPKFKCFMFISHIDKMPGIRTGILVSNRSLMGFQL